LSIGDGTSTDELFTFTVIQILTLTVLLIYRESKVEDKDEGLNCRVITLLYQPLLFFASFARTLVLIPSHSHDSFQSNQ
jgi:hypothetical protein